ncbi:MAG TPA: hypothetical protein VJ866_20440 [Pyrinomonadaceae bacterium]|nr:hypothetical protein [Pyrinomonadaceae bacterium]
MRKATHMLRALAGSALLVALASAATWAQQPTAKPSPSPEKSAQTKTQSSTPDVGDEAGDYTVTSSVEIGYRGLRVDGDLNKYQSDLNYKAGSRLFDTTFLIQARPGAKGAFLDSLVATTTGWGSDPYGHMRVSMENSKWFRFDGSYRRFKYFNYLNNIANPRTSNNPTGTAAFIVLPANPVRGRHDYDVTQQVGDFDLTLLPKNEKLRFTFGYSPGRYSGLAFTTYHAFGGEYYFPAQLTSRTNDFRLGVDFKLGPVDFSLLQGFRRFHDDSTIDFSGLTTNYLATTTTNVGAVTGFRRTQPVEGSTDYTRFSAHTLLARRLDMTGRFIYSRSDAGFTFAEDVTGVNFNTRVTGAPTTGAASGSIDYTGNTKRPNVIGDFGVTYIANDRLRLSNTFRAETFHINGATFYTSAFNLTRTNGTAYPTIAATGLLGTSKVSSYRKISDTVEGDFQFNASYSVHFGYRYGARRETVFYGGYNPGAYTPAAVAPETELEENHTNVFFGGFKARPVKTWTVFFNAERGTADNIFTRVGEYNYTNIRARSRYTPNRKLALNFSVVTRDNSDPTTVEGVSLADFGVSTKSRVFASSVDFVPNSRLSFSGGYNYNWLNSDAVINYTYAVPPFPTSPALPGSTQGSINGHSLYFVRNNFFYLDTTAQVLPRLMFYAAYRINKDTGQGDRVQNPSFGNGLLITSYPMSYQSPEARLSYRVNRRLDLNAGYQYYNYNESAYARAQAPFIAVPAQNYHAHLPYASLRFYFGNGDR